MARVKESGFNINMPGYHGTNTAFNAFDPAKAGLMTGAASARQGVWLALDPHLADYFARLAVERSGGNAQIYPLLVRSERPTSLTLIGDEMHHEIASTLAQAWDDGYTSVLLRNYKLENGKTGEILVVRDPSQLRSPYAVFDPAKRDSTHLLAGFAGLGLLGGAASGVGRTER